MLTNMNKDNSIFGPKGWVEWFNPSNSAYDADIFNHGEGTDGTWHRNITLASSAEPAGASAADFVRPHPPTDMPTSPPTEPVPEHSPTEPVPPSPPE